VASDLGIRVEDEELLAENFATLGALDALIASKLRKDLQD
jgi:hypothetical protein